MLCHHKDTAVFCCTLSAVRAVAAEILLLTLAAAIMKHVITDNKWYHNTNYKLTAFCVGGRLFPFFVVKSQVLNGKMKFELTPDIPVIAGDGITYGVACL